MDPQDQVLAALRCLPAHPAGEPGAQREQQPRAVRSVLDALREHAGAAHVRIALAETRGVAVRWVDGIVTGTVDDLVVFLTASEPVLSRCHARAQLAA